MKKIFLLIISAIAAQHCSGTEAFNALSTIDKFKAGSLLVFALSSTVHAAMFTGAIVARSLDSHYKTQYLDEETGETITIQNYPDDIKHYCAHTLGCVTWASILWYALKKYYNISPIA